MNWSEKINTYLKEQGYSKQQLANELGLNYQRMSKNIAANKLTIDIALGMARIFPGLDMNWFMRDDSIMTINEPGATYTKEKTAEDIVVDLERKIAELKVKLSQK